MVAANWWYVAVRIFFQPSDYCGLGLDIAGIGYDISGNHWIALNAT